ncbi:MAG: hypothetical protein ACYCW6_08160, partial [Candidatus Xenobia bacterium]
MLSDLLNSSGVTRVSTATSSGGVLAAATTGTTVFAADIVGNTDEVDLFGLNSSGTAGSFANSGSPIATLSPTPTDNILSVAMVSSNLGVLSTDGSADGDNVQLVSIGSNSLTLGAQAATDGNQGANGIGVFVPGTGNPILVSLNGNNTLSGFTITGGNALTAANTDRKLDFHLEHPFVVGANLVETPEPVERTEHLYRFRFDVPPKES